ncbi:hypothetical protein ACWDE9_44010, partial [Streptomyces olivaceoviridis]
VIAISGYHGVRASARFGTVLGVFEVLVLLVFVTTFLDWTARVLEARGVPARSLVAALGALGHQLRDFPRSLHLLRRGTAALTDRPLRTADTCR